MRNCLHNKYISSIQLNVVFKCLSELTNSSLYTLVYVEIRGDIPNLVGLVLVFVQLLCRLASIKRNGFTFFLFTLTFLIDY